MLLGFHVSIAGGLDNSVRRAARRRCTTVQIFTGAPVQWARKGIGGDECDCLAEGLSDIGVSEHFVHAKYLLNVCSPDLELREKSVADLCEEVAIARGLRAAGVIMHLGSVGSEGSIEEGTERVARAIDAACEAVPDGPAIILENSAGQGNIVGATFEQLAAIIAATRCPERVRCCVDTAHAFGAGIGLHTEDGLEAMLAEIERTFGLARLALLHVNDSKVPFGSGRDRHWHIGRGEIGRDAMTRIVNHPRLVHLPFVMETPGTEADDLSNMRRIRRLIRPEVRPPLPALPADLR